MCQQPFTLLIPSIQQATLTFTTDTTLPYSDQHWQTVPAWVHAMTVRSQQFVAEGLPDQATIWLRNITDERGATVYSLYQFKPMRE